jgi:hypothetical protein
MAIFFAGHYGETAPEMTSGETGKIAQELVDGGWKLPHRPFQLS